MRECNSYEGCDAPLCPLDPNVGKRIWLVSEDVCRKRGLKLDWLKTQKKIARKAINKFLFFKVADLKRIKNVHKGIRGHNPDRKTWEARASGKSKTFRR